MCSRVLAFRICGENEGEPHDKTNMIWKLDLCKAVQGLYCRALFNLHRALGISCVLLITRVMGLGFRTGSYCKLVIV